MENNWATVPCSKRVAHGADNYLSEIIAHVTRHAGVTDKDGSSPWVQYLNPVCPKPEFDREIVSMRTAHEALEYWNDVMSEQLNQNQDFHTQP